MSEFKKNEIVYIPQHDHFAKIIRVTELNKCIQLYDLLILNDDDYDFVWGVSSDIFVKVNKDIRLIELLYNKGAII